MIKFVKQQQQKLKQLKRQQDSRLYYHVSLGLFFQLLQVKKQITYIYIIYINKNHILDN